MDRYLNLLVAKGLLPTLLFVSSAIANPWMQAIQAAKHEVKIMAPGLYSVKLIRQFEIDPKIQYKIIIRNAVVVSFRMRIYYIFFGMRIFLII